MAAVNRGRVMNWSQIIQLAQIAYKAHHDGSAPKRWDDLNDWERDDWVRTVRAVLRHANAMVAA